MTALVYLSLGLFALVGLGYATWLLFVARRNHGVRVVTCPENHQPAAVNLDLVRALKGVPFDTPDPRLKTCSRWPEHSECGQACLGQIEAAPDGCLARAMLTDWYVGKNCAVCGTHIDAVQWIDHKPGLMSPEGKVLDWKEIIPENIPATLETHRPVCWNCFISEAFRQHYPELVTDRMAHR
jgi:hypothetical protein